MDKNTLLLAIDQGTTSTRAIVFNTAGEIVASTQKELPQIYPQEGWVEHDPETIWRATLEVSKQAFEAAESKGGQVVGMGIANQRETTILWDRRRGDPVHNAIVWQDRRTTATCGKLRELGFEDTIQTKTGLLLDPYFSATKLAWILDHVDGARTQANKGALLFGTVDSFLLWRFTSGQVHATDSTNASRTDLFNICEHQWDEELLALFQVPRACLPSVHDSAFHFGQTDPSIFGRSIPILGIAGDQQAAAFGQCCFAEGTCKSTYGTGCFLLVNTGQTPIKSSSRLLTTIAYRLSGQTTYALEGSIFVAGAAVQWLRDDLNIITEAAETERLAKSIKDTGGVYLVPAFTGLGAPYWDPTARGMLAGITRSTGRAEIARAALEASCYQTADLLAAMAKDGIHTVNLRVDGGMTKNDWLLQYLANILGLGIDRPDVMETSALGAAYLAGLQAGVFESLDDIVRNWRKNSHFDPKITASERRKLLSGWRTAVRRTLNR
ncbi:MAG: Glycerol kinase [Alphaproteobacteria bacterium MarineAlpha9_Bin7]|nr:MAG: Glycerol kinase [Alphaproteobacteria bacterium MarineAlpha9_Bin7]